MNASLMNLELHEGE